jgi:hypothetical protein
MGLLASKPSVDRPAFSGRNISNSVHDADGLTLEELNTIAEVHSLPRPTCDGSRTGTLHSGWVDEENGGRRRQVTLTYTRTQTNPERFRVRVLDESRLED